MRLNLQEHNIEVLDVTTAEVRQFLDNDNLEGGLLDKMHKSGYLASLERDVDTGKYREAHVVIRIQKD